MSTTQPMGIVIPLFPQGNPQSLRLKANQNRKDISFSIGDAVTAYNGTRQSHDKGTVTGLLRDPDGTLTKVRVQCASYSGWYPLSFVTHRTVTRG